VARLTVTRGCGPRGYGLEGCDTPLWTLTCRPYERPEFAAGVTLAPVSIGRNPSSPLSGLKTVSALETILMLDQARRAGADEALVMTLDGIVASAAAANLFWAREGRLETPSAGCGILEGITRARALDIAREEGIDVAEGRYAPGILREASEMFVTNSLVEIVPVRRVKNFFEAAAPGPVTALLSRRYRELTGQ